MARLLSSVVLTQVEYPASPDYRVTVYRVTPTTNDPDHHDVKPGILRQIIRRFDLPTDIFG